MSALDLLPEAIAGTNAEAADAHARDLDALAAKLERKGLDADALKAKVAAFTVAIPSWGTGTGGTRFARFPGPGEPAGIFDKLDDCAAIHRLCRATPDVSLHFPWDGDDPAALKQKGDALGIGFDAVNSNTFQDQPDQAHSYKHGSLSHQSKATRDQAIAHNIRCIEIGAAIGSKALTVWVGDGTNFPGQQDFTGQLDRYLESAKAIYAALPSDWRMFTEHKIYEPAFYSTIVQDWGTSYLIATELGDKAQCLVDLGHHAPTVNVEMIVARLAAFGKLGGFHFNDSKYGDDDLDSGAIDPYRLFLVMNEVLRAEAKGANLAHMIDQSHNVTDPIESLIASANEARRAYAQALLVDQDALRHAQESNDALLASETLKAAFRTDVEPLLAEVRREAGGALDPLVAYRASGYRQAVAKERPVSSGAGGGIV
ncbi:MAG: L-rhamnose catabolism isomerase [Devosiaceae bacterium]|nr:L-rhamnose catabolism isomerase [Devosiaceae bacterium MH13]